jgi:hypothetical protein
VSAFADANDTDPVETLDTTMQVLPFQSWSSDFA